jgi:cathepsin B
LVFSCNGGDHKSAFEYFINQGIVTGGKYESKTGCKPYPIQPDLKEDSPTSTQCTNSCDVSYKNSYTNDKIKGKGLIPFLYSNQQVMDEIIREGPVVAEFKLYSDFLNYSGGVYQHKTGKLHGYYYAKIIGWGKSEQVEFWRAVASFGPNWGKVNIRIIIF